MITISTIFEYKFIQNAILASIFASIICGIIGVIIVEKKLVMMTGGISHTSYGGVGLGYFLGIEPIFGAFFISIISSVIIGTIQRNKNFNSNSDLIVGIFWSFGMALGIIFIALTPGYPPDLSSYLFGNILTVMKSDLILIGIISVIIVFCVTSLFNYLVAFIFDDEFTTVLGIKTVFLDYLIYVLIALSVVALIRIVGIILVMTLFTGPTAISNIFFKKIKSRMISSILLGLLFCLMGLFLSYKLNISSGAVIVVITSLAYFICLVAKKLCFNKSKE